MVPVLYVSYRCFLKSSGLTMAFLTRTHKRELESFLGNECRMIPDTSLVVFEELLNLRSVRASVLISRQDIGNVCWRLRVSNYFTGYGSTNRIARFVSNELGPLEVLTSQTYPLRPHVSRMLEMIDYSASLNGIAGSL